MLESIVSLALGSIGVSATMYNRDHVPWDIDAKLSEWKCLSEFEKWMKHVGDKRWNSFSLAQAADARRKR